MARRKKLLKMELLNSINKAHATSDKIIQTMEEVFETVVRPEPVVEKAAPEPIVEEVVEKPKTSTRKRYSRTKKTTGV